MKLCRCVFIIVSAVDMVACATPDDLRKRQPTAIIENRHPAAEVAACIADRLENETSLGAPVVADGLRTRATATGHVVTIINRAGAVFFMADIIARGSRSLTNYYDYLVPDPSKVKVATAFPPAYSYAPPEPYISVMHKAVIACSR